MIYWPEKSVDAVAFLFRKYNDIDVYVEDARYKTIYEIYLKRILKDRCNIRSVIPVGDKEKVIEKCKNDQKSGGRRRIYLVDGDLDLIIGRKIDNLKRLYRINAYCIENLLVSAEAVCEIMYETHGDMSVDEAQKQFCFSLWKKDVETKLLKLFLLYAVAFEKNLKLNHSTVNFNVEAFYEGKGSNRDISERKLDHRFKIVRDEMKTKIKAGEIDRRIKELKRNIKNGEIEIYLYFSGKTYILPLVRLRLQKLVQFRDSMGSMKIRMARHTSLDIDSGLRLAVQNASRGRVWLNKNA